MRLMVSQCVSDDHIMKRNERSCISKIEYMVFGNLEIMNKIAREVGG